MLAHRAQIAALRRSQPAGALEAHTGVVISVDSTTPPSVTLTLDGDSTHIPEVRYLASYTPAAGDVVVVLEQAMAHGRDRWVSGKLA